MRQSSLLEGNHLQREAEQAKQRAQELEEEARVLQRELDEDEDPAEEHEVVPAAEDLTPDGVQCSGNHTLPELKGRRAKFGSSLSAIKGKLRSSWRSTLSRRKPAAGRGGRVDSNAAFIPDEINPLFKGDSADGNEYDGGPANMRSPALVAGPAMGSVMMSSMDMADVMSQMLSEVSVGRVHVGEQENATTCSSTAAAATLESAMNVVQLRRKVAQAHEDALKAGPNGRLLNRMTVIDHDFVVTEEDLEMAILEEEASETGETDEPPDEEAFDEVTLDESEHVLEVGGLKVTAKVMACIPGEIPAQDAYQIQLACGDEVWELTKFYTDLIELRNALLEEELGPIVAFAETLPKLRCDDHPGDDEDRLEDIAAWIDGLLQSMGVANLLEIPIIDEFFEAFWHVEEVRRAGPPILDLLKHSSLSRADTEVALASTPIGTFLIRTRKSGEMVLSVSHVQPPCGKPTFWHGIIEKGPPQQGSSASPTFFMKGTKVHHASLEALLTHHKNFPYSLSAGRHVLGDFYGAEDTPC
jgi:hypothetical protein